MKTPAEIIQWTNMMLNMNPNEEDKNFFKSIKYYMENQPQIGEWVLDYGNNVYFGLKPKIYMCSQCGMVDNDTPIYCKYCGSKNKR